jgi:hypothetical protein
MTLTAGSVPRIVAPGAAAASMTSLRSIRMLSLQVPLIWISRGLRSSPLVSALARVSPAAQSTETDLMESPLAGVLIANANAPAASAAE